MYSKTYASVGCKSKKTFKNLPFGTIKIHLVFLELQPIAFLLKYISLFSFPVPERNFGSATEDFSNKYLDFLAQIYPGLKEDVPQNSYLIFSLCVPTIVI